MGPWARPLSRLSSRIPSTESSSSLAESVIPRQSVHLPSSHPDQRTHCPKLQTANLGNEDIDARTTVLQVDYKNMADLTSMLETYEIDTVISALHTTEQSLAVSQVNLIAAAEAARCTNCFVPSTFAMPYPEE